MSQSGVGLVVFCSFPRWLVASSPSSAKVHPSSIEKYWNAFYLKRNNFTNIIILSISEIIVMKYIELMLLCLPAKEGVHAAS